MSIDLVGLDADDTLWHSEGHYRATQERYAELLEPWIAPGGVPAVLLETERRNLGHFGYGAKGFTLSMIETAIEISTGEVDGARIQKIIEFGRDLLNHPVELLDGVSETLEALASDFRLALVTKGDLFHQESKIAASGLADLFERVEILSEKDPRSYARVLTDADVAPQRFCMVGNSVRSDIAPVLELGGAGVHVPYEVTWAMEHAEVDDGHPRLGRAESILEVPAAIETLAAA